MLRRRASHAQREIAAQGKSDEKDRLVSVSSTDLAYGVYHLEQSAGVEQLDVEVMGFTVVAEIQAKGIVTGTIKRGGSGQQIVRLAAALPAMEKDDQSVATMQGRTIQKPEQSRPVRGLDDLALTGGQIIRSLALHPPLANRAGGQQGLDMAVSQQSPRLVGAKIDAAEFRTHSWPRRPRYMHGQGDCAVRSVPERDHRSPRELRRGPVEWCGTDCRRSFVRARRPWCHADRQNDHTGSRPGWPVHQPEVPARTGGRESV